MSRHWRATQQGQQRSPGRERLQPYPEIKASNKYLLSSVHLCWQAARQLRCQRGAGPPDRPPLAFVRSQPKPSALPWFPEISSPPAPAYHKPLVTSGACKHPGCTPAFDMLRRGAQQLASSLVEQLYTSSSAAAASCSSWQALRGICGTACTQRRLFPPTVPVRPDDGEEPYR